MLQFLIESLSLIYFLLNISIIIKKGYRLILITIHPKQQLYVSKKLVSLGRYYRIRQIPRVILCGIFHFVKT